MGDAAQNLSTTLGYGVTDLFTRTTRLSATQRDIPLTRLFSGRLDTVGGATWNAQQVQAYRDLDAGALGYQLFWDLRTHNLGSFPANHWGTSTYHAATSLTRFRNDVSYPGISGFDAAPGTPDRLPDPGDGTLATGSNVGTWGGWVDWDDATLLDSATEWSCSLWLVTQSANPADNCAAASATSHLSIRRPQGFVPSAGEGLVWDLVRVVDGALLQSGSVVVGTDEVVTVNDIALLPEPGVRLRVRTCAPAYPGTGEDLVLLTGINGAINGCHRKTAQAGDLFDLQVSSPAGGFNFATLVVYAQPFATGGPPPMTAGFPGLWIDLLSPKYAVFNGIANPMGGGLDPAGFSFGPIVVGPALVGQSVMIQGGVLSPMASNGLYATTAGHEIVVH